MSQTTEEIAKLKDLSDDELKAHLFTADYRGPEVKKAAFDLLMQRMAEAIIIALSEQSSEGEEHA